MTTTWILLLLAGTILLATGEILRRKKSGPDRLSQMIRSLGAWMRRRWAEALVMIGALMIRKGMNLLGKAASSPVSSGGGDPFDDFVTDYLDKHA
jgi:hypothetical protein